MKPTFELIEVLVWMEGETEPRLFLLKPATIAFRMQMLDALGTDQDVRLWTIPELYKGYVYMLKRRLVVGRTETVKDSEGNEHTLTSQGVLFGDLEEQPTAETHVNMADLGEVSILTMWVLLMNPLQAKGVVGRELAKTFHDDAEAAVSPESGREADQPDPERGGGPVRTGPPGPDRPPGV